MSDSGNFEDKLNIYQQLKEENLTKLKEKYYEEEEYPFHPQINDK